jgi:hypothetical protein
MDRVDPVYSKHHFLQAGPSGALLDAAARGADNCLRMKTLRVSLDESLFDEMDRTVTALGTTPSDFTRDALRAALGRVNERELEARHRAGSERYPVQPGELDGWTDEQVWPE